MSIRTAVKRWAVTSIVTLVCIGRISIAAANDAPTPAQETLANMEKSMPDDPQGRFYKLGQLAQAAFDAGAMDKADDYANQLLSASSNYPRDWNYGNAIFFGNTVLGLVALKRDHNLSAADGYLIASGLNRGSPQLDSFGPNMRLAKELLAAGERDIVANFLVECKGFWEMGRLKLDSWIEAIHNGETPDFGANLRYSF